jgi:hypothetical protein
MLQLDRHLSTVKSKRPFKRHMRPLIQNSEEDMMISSLKKTIEGQNLILL